MSPSHNTHGNQLEQKYASIMHKLSRRPLPWPKAGNPQFKQTIQCIYEFLTQFPQMKGPLKVPKLASQIYHTLRGCGTLRRGTRKLTPWYTCHATISRQNCAELLTRCNSFTNKIKNSLPNLCATWPDIIRTRASRETVLSFIVPGTAKWRNVIRYTCISWNRLFPHICHLQQYKRRSVLLSYYTGNHGFWTAWAQLSASIIAQRISELKMINTPKLRLRYGIFLLHFNH